jgi:hypothetical protein
MRRSRPTAPQVHTYPPVLLKVEHGIVVRLRREAARRDWPVERLISELLDAIATDRLVDAVLDDLP